MEVVSFLYFSNVFNIFSAKISLSSLFSINISSTLLSVKFTVFLFFVFAPLNSKIAIAISRDFEEFVIVIVEFPFIAKNPVALNFKFIRIYDLCMFYSSFM